MLIKKNLRNIELNLIKKIGKSTNPEKINPRTIPIEQIIKLLNDS